MFPTLEWAYSMAEHQQSGDDTHRNQNHLLPSLLESLSQTCDDLQSKSIYISIDGNSPSIKSLLEFESNSSTFFSHYPDLLNLTHFLAHLKTLINKLKSSQSYSLRSFLLRRFIEYQIYRELESIQSEIRSWFDRDIVLNLVQVLQESSDNEEEEEKVKALVQLERRVSMGFDKNLQDLILREKVFNLLESVLCNDSCLPTIRENSALGIAALASFNKNVFVGLVLMGFSVRALVKLGTSGSLHVLSVLIRLIKGHLVDELDLSGEIPRIISKLTAEHLRVKTMAMDCLLEMAYYGRKEAIDTLLECGLIEKLVNLQRVELGVGLVEEDEETDEERRLSDHPFSGCISRFAVQVEVGEGMDKVEKKRVKLEILKRAREASVCEAEAAAIVAQVLWGSSP